mgnify:CR=1 FL=1
MVFLIPLRPRSYRVAFGDLAVGEFVAVVDHRSFRRAGGQRDDSALARGQGRDPA